MTHYDQIKQRLEELARKWDDMSARLKSGVQYDKTALSHAEMVSDLTAGGLTFCSDELRAILKDWPGEKEDHCIHFNESGTPCGDSACAFCCRPTQNTGG